ncbi:MAG TPA: organic solvent tolerance protein OstA [Flammeovirgaceae bacterium]|nr:organic solvent tolerance protein OstA [Flammeovirgaceae bacterium]
MYFCTKIASHSTIKIYPYHIALLICLLPVLPLQAQKKIKLEPGAEQLSGFKKDGITYTSVKGNVEFTHQDTRFFCDSAVLARRTNYLEAYGHVRILDGDSVTLTADKLFYDGNTRVARLRDRVVLTQLGRMQLFTDNLDYDRNTAIAYYFGGGKIVDTTNVLVSERGYYNTRTNTASFKNNVVGKNDDYTMVSDTLVYNTNTGIVYFVAPTVLTDSEGNVFHHDHGQYDSRRKHSVYFAGKVETEDYYLKGKNMVLDDIRGEYHVQGDVLLVAKEDQIFITGQQATYHKASATTKVYDQALLRMVSEGDTLYLVADTLVSIDSKADSLKRLLAYNNVRVYKSDIQAIADSVAYLVADSLMNFYGTPVMWTDDNQLTADTIELVINNGAVSRLHLQNKAFVITQDSAGNYNQIKGRTMVAWFQDNELSRVDVHGNGESIFFMYDEEEGYLLGMNRIICSDITLIFADKRLVDASFKVNPEGRFIPPHELKPADKTLKDFAWYGDKRPQLEDFKRPPIVIEPLQPALPGQINLELKQVPAPPPGPAPPVRRPQKLRKMKKMPKKAKNR